MSFEQLSLTSMRQVRDSRCAPQNPKSPMRKIMIPAIIRINTDSSMDDNGKVVKLNRLITCRTSGRSKK
jgi:hypothetical protein